MGVIYLLQGPWSTVLNIIIIMKKLKKRKNFIVLWDFDGTLVDTMREHIKLASGVMAKYFKINMEIAKKEYIKTTGLPFDKQLEIIFPGEKYKEKRLLGAKEYHKRKIKSVYKNPQPIKGALEILRILQKEGYQQFILSGTEEKIVKQWLRKMKISQVEVLGKEQGIKKDHIKILKNNFPRAKFLIISDSLKDLLLPVDIKIGFYKNEKEKMWLSKAKPDFLINDLGKLKELLY